MMKPKSVKWGIRGVPPEVDPEPTRRELEERIAELDAECDWYNSWVSDLLQIAMHHAKDVSKLQADIEQAEAKSGRFAFGRQKGASVNQSRAAEREKWADENWPKALAAAQRDKNKAYLMMRDWMLEWEKCNPGQKAWSLRTIQDRY